jgi:RNA polymerase sigma-B factor
MHVTHHGADPTDDDLFEQLGRAHDPAVRNELVLRYQWLARRCASSMSNRGVPLADLVQVAEIGLIKAVERYDPRRGVAFSSFAVPTVLGEIRRHFRDTTWAVSVPRSAKERRGRVQAATEHLHQALGRTPTTEEIADHCGLDAPAVTETQFANTVYRCSSLEQARDETGDLVETRSVDSVRAPDPLASTELHIEAVRAIAELPERSRKIILWRFYEECTQREIGERLGVGQVQVSRLLRAALDQLGDRLSSVRYDILESA